MIETNSVGDGDGDNESGNRDPAHHFFNDVPEVPEEEQGDEHHALVGGVAIGQVMRRQISNWRTADGWKTSLANHSMLTAYRNIEMTSSQREMRSLSRRCCQV